MSRFILISALTALLATSSVAPGQLGTYDWNKITSYATWINSYNEPCQLTLSVNRVPAMRKLRPGSVFARTKFPPGSFEGAISDSRTGETIKIFPLSIKDNSSVLLISRGNDKLGCEVFQIRSEAPSTNGQKKPKTMTVVNAFPDGKLTLMIGGQSPQTIDVKDVSILPISKENMAFPVTVQLATPDGKTRTEKVNLSTFLEHGGVVVFHCDEVEQNIVRYSVFDGETFDLLASDEEEKNIE